MRQRNTLELPPGERAIFVVAATNHQTCFVTPRQLASITGIPRLEIRRMQRCGKFRAYGGTQPTKKRYVFDLFEAIAAIKQENQTAGRLAFDDEALFRRHNIPSLRAFSGVN